MVHSILQGFIGKLLDISNDLIITWCSIGALGCNANNGNAVAVDLPITLNQVMTFANALPSDTCQGDWARTNHNIGVSVSSVTLGLWNFGSWGAHGTKVIVIGY